jgi:shikimate kinase
MKLFLIGMMGSGKSYWKKKLASKMKIGGYDLDFLVESHEEKTISEIFAEDGEDYFRKSEAKVLRWFGEKKAFVLATGGGTPCFHDNMKWMNEQGVTVWIDEPVQTLAERLINEKSHRPAIANLSFEELVIHLEQRKEERKQFYSQAQHQATPADLNDAWFAKLLKKYA